MVLRQALVAGAASALLAGCAGSAAGSTAAVTFPHPATVLAGTTLYTSPDGGIYQNADPIQLLMVVRQSAAPVMRQLGSPAASWTALQRFGDFTYVGMSITNRGAAGSDPQLNATQIASDFAPSGTDTGPLRHFYHPMFPLAILRTQSSDVECGVHLDPGHSATLVLVYPPISATDSIVWGMYKTFAVRAAFGGGVSHAVSGWRASACTPPQPTPGAGA